MNYELSGNRSARGKTTSLMSGSASQHSGSALSPRAPELVLTRCSKHQQDTDLNFIFL